MSLLLEWDGKLQSRAYAGGDGHAGRVGGGDETTSTCTAGSAVTARRGVAS